MYVRPLVVNSPSLKELKILKSRVKSGRVGQCAAGITLIDNHSQKKVYNRRPTRIHKVQEDICKNNI